MDENRLGELLKSNPEFAEALRKADSAEGAAAVARGFGLELDAEQLDAAFSAGELSDQELAEAAGGYTFPRTDWVYCDNPWTNYWCTLKC